MRLLPKFFPCLIVVLATATTAENTAPELLSPDQIVEHYQESAVSWPVAPRIAVLAFVAAEDRRFFERPAKNSTITRQIGRWYLQPGAERAESEALSMAISERLSHDEVLNWYVNEVFLGQTCFGISSAAEAYFGKPVADLNLEEIAYLAALPKAPMRFHPVRSHDRALERRNFVLAEMLEANFISAEEADRAIHSALRAIDPIQRCEVME